MGEWIRRVGFCELKKKNEDLEEESGEMGCRLLWNLERKEGGEVKRRAICSLLELQRSSFLGVTSATSGVLEFSQPKEKDEDDNKSNQDEDFLDTQVNI